MKSKNCSIERSKAVEFVAGTKTVRLVPSNCKRIKADCLASERVNATQNDCNRSVQRFDRKHREVWRRDVAMPRSRRIRRPSHTAPQQFYTHPAVHRFRTNNFPGNCFTTRFISRLNSATDTAVLTGSEMIFWATEPATSWLDNFHGRVAALHLRSPIFQRHRVRRKFLRSTDSLSREKIVLLQWERIARTK